MSYIKDGIHRTDDEVLIKSLQILADNIQSDDGVANECIREAALRLSELVEENNKLNHKESSGLLSESLNKHRALLKEQDK